MQEGKMVEARNVLEKALESAQTIPSEPSRNHTISSIQQALAKSTLKGERN